MAPAKNMPVEIPCPELTDQLTVMAWVDCAETRPEAMQALVSKWRPPDTFEPFDAFDAAGTDGLDSTGYFGAVFDGRYVYFVPEMHGDRTTHAVVLRYDTHGDFSAPASYTAYDASNTDGLETRGFYGAVFDGRYVYFVPRQLGVAEYHSRVLRLDTKGELKDPASWAAFDVGEKHSQQSAAFDGRYIYFCPGFAGDPTKEDEYCGRVIRFDTQSDFKSRSSYTSVDITQFLGPEAACFDGGAFDGRYVYFVPLYSGVAVRYDTSKPFGAAHAWEAYDAKPHGYQLAVGAVFDGTYLYYCAYGHANIVRFDTRKPFTDPDNWETHGADNTDGLRTTGFDGGFFDGRFVYFQPFFLRTGPEKYDVIFHSHYLRHDPTREFADPASWQACDASATDGLHSVGYNGGAFDGRYFYAAPWQQGRDPERPDRFVTHGVVLRCDTLGEHGSFSLRYCDYGHNGGLNAGVPGPNFLVNTENGVLGVGAHDALPPGKHHLAGTYDGHTIKLFIDGRLAAQREGRGRIQPGNEPVVLGCIQDGLGRFEGDIMEALVRDYVHTDTEIAAIAHDSKARDCAAATLAFELDTYVVLDERDELTGKVTVPLGTGSWVQVTLTRLDDGEQCWQQTVSLTPGAEAEERPLAVPVRDLDGGYYRLRAQGETGESSAVMIAVRQVVPAPVVAAPDCLEFVTEAVEKLLDHEVKRLGGSPRGTRFITVSRRSGRSYRSLGHKDGDEYRTCWFPEKPFEYDAFRADHEIWSVLDRLSDLTGEPRYRDLVTAMLDAVAEHGFDPRSGLAYLSEESDLHVPENRVCPSKSTSTRPSFKPRNSGHNPGMPLERMWERMPAQLRRCYRAMYHGLITDPTCLDYNRFCMYGFSDAEAKPSLHKNAGNCAFDTAGGRMIHWWSSCWAHAGDADCLHWAQRMTDKWQAVMHPTTGLIPNFFGAAGWQPGADQMPGKWAETRGSALTAVSWLEASQELSARPGAESLQTRLADMALHLARGVADHVYDAEQHRFREHLRFDGGPYEDTARYCFRTQAEKDAAVREDPRMAQVIVYDGAGFYRHPNYYEQCVGSSIPFHLTQVAAATGDAALIEHAARFAADAVEEARQLDGAFTPEGRWTFRATGWHITMCILLQRATGDGKYLDWAAELAEREISALRQVTCPHWWRLRERSTFLAALLELHAAQGGAAL